MSDSSESLAASSPVKTNIFLLLALALLKGKRKKEDRRGRVPNKGRRRERSMNKEVGRSGSFSAAMWEVVIALVCGSGNDGEGFDIGRM